MVDEVVDEPGDWKAFYKDFIEMYLKEIEANASRALSEAVSVYQFEETQVTGARTQLVSAINGLLGPSTGEPTREPPEIALDNRDWHERWKETSDDLRQTFPNALSDPGAELAKKPLDFRKMDEDIRSDRAQPVMENANSKKKGPGDATGKKKGAAK